MPDSADSIVQLVQITDTHLSADKNHALLGLNTDYCLTTVIDHAIRQHTPKFVVATGDLAHDGSSCAYQRLAEHVKKFKKPIYCLPGNHDDVDVLRTELNHGQIKTCDTLLTDNGWLMIFLNSTITGSEGGHIDEQEMYRLKETLQCSTEHPTLIWLHHQPVCIGSNWLDSMAVDNGRKLLTLLEHYRQVRAVIWGHVHQAFEAQHKHIRLLASPSTCIQFKPNSKTFAIDHLPPGYRWLTLHKNGEFETGVERLPQIPGKIDLDNRGY